MKGLEEKQRKRGKGQVQLMSAESDERGGGARQREARKVGDAVR